MFADGYTELWKKVDDATKRDMPKTQIQHLEAIAAKAAKEKNYGQMLKAEWRMMWAWSTISPDSVAPQMSRLELEAEEYGRTDPALAAICYAALGKTCGEMPALRHGGDSAAQAYFKKALDHSPIEYINKYRIKQALSLLEKTDLSVMEICLECGYNNLGNFLREFRKYTNTTPLQYRKNAK